jgi:RNA-binding protein
MAVFWPEAPSRLQLILTNSMTLTERQKKHLRGLAHAREPVVLIGQSGLSEGVIRELDGALNSHELVKVRARVGDREGRDQILEELATRTSSTLVQQIGNVGVFYRANKEKPRIILPSG